MMDTSPEVAGTQPLSNAPAPSPSMRERLLRHGAPALTDAELLALLTHLPGGPAAAESL
jgi:hypothetical protein